MPSSFSPVASIIFPQPTQPEQWAEPGWVSQGSGERGSLPVSEADAEVESDEDEELAVEEFVDTPFPSDQELREGSKADISYSICVCHRHHRACEKQNMETLRPSGNLLRGWKEAGVQQGVPVMS